jgi:hypothetical protein
MTEAVNPMSNIDRQRVTAVRTLQLMGYVFCDGVWVVGPAARPSTAEADASLMRSAISWKRNSTASSQNTISRARHLAGQVEEREMQRRWDMLIFLATLALIAAVLYASNPWLGMFELPMAGR